MIIQTSIILSNQSSSKWNLFALIYWRMSFCTGLFKDYKTKPSLDKKLFPVHRRNTGLKVATIFVEIFFFFFFKDFFFIIYIIHLNIEISKKNLPDCPFFRQAGGQETIG